MTRFSGKKGFSTRLAWGLGLLIFSALIGCGGGGGGGETPAPPPSASITGSVSGTIVLAIDETGNIAATDDTADNPVIPNSNPLRKPFTLNLLQGHMYHLFFIVDEGTPAERIVPLVFPTNPPTNVFSVGSVSSIDLGIVNTSGAQATAEKSPFVTGVTPGPQTGSPTIRVEGFKYFLLLDHPDGSIRYRVQVRVLDAAGNALTNKSLVSGMKVYGPIGTELALDGGFMLWNGSDFSSDNGDGIVSNPNSDIEQYLAATPGTLSAGFYTVIVTDNNGNLYSSALYHGTPVQVAKPTGLTQTINADNSITLSWTNPSGISAPAYSLAVAILSDDANGDGLPDYPLFAYRSASTTSYTIPVGFIQSTLFGKTGLKWMVEVRQRPTSSVTFPDGTTSSDAQFYRNRSPQATLTLPALPPASFSQADLTGTWDIMQFKASSQGGWMRGVVRIDGNGHVIVDDNTTFQSTVADDSFPNGDTGMIWTITPSGVLSLSGDPTTTGYHGNLSTNKQIAVATLSLIPQSGPTEKAFLILRKRIPGVTYGSTDLANKSFRVHALESGNAPKLVWGDGSFDANGVETLANIYFSTGEHFTNIQEGNTFSVDPAGVVTSSLGPDFKGFLTPDKKILIATETSQGTNFALGIFTISGQTFATSDMAGIWKGHSLSSGSTPQWIHSTVTFDSAGNGTYSDLVADPTEELGPFTLTLSSTGEILQPSWPPTHGSMSYGKDFMCITHTEGPSSFAMDLMVK